MSVDLSILEQRRASLDSQPLDERERHEYREALGDLVGFDDEQLAHVTAPLDDAQLIGLLIYERNVEARHSRMDAAAESHRAFRVALHARRDAFDKAQDAALDRGDDERTARADAIERQAKAWRTEGS